MKNAKFSREVLAQLSQLVELSLPADSRRSIFDEICKLMSLLDFTVDFSEFSRFYGFVYFICRENGQKNITVKKAVGAWRIVLAGRFRLLNQWCDFVEKNQRHNISEDSWRQVLAFSRCVHENLKGYDPAGAWPVLIDDFVEHMYRISGPMENYDDMESHPCSCDDSLPGLKSIPGLKRKSVDDMETDDLVSLINTFPSSTNLGPGMSFKRSKPISYKPPIDLMKTRRHSYNSNCVQLNSSSKSQCAIEGCLSEGLAGIFPSRSCLQFKRETLIPFGQSYEPL